MWANQEPCRGPGKRERPSASPGNVSWLTPTVKNSRAVLEKTQVSDSLRSGPYLLGLLSPDEAVLGKNTCTPTFMAALVPRDKIRKQSRGKFTCVDNIMRYIFTSERAQSHPKGGKNAICSDKGGPSKGHRKPSHVYIVTSFVCM